MVRSIGLNFQALYFFLENYKAFLPFWFPSEVYLNKYDYCRKKLIISNLKEIVQTINNLIAIRKK